MSVEEDLADETKVLPLVLLHRVAVLSVLPGLLRFLLFALAAFIANFRPVNDNHHK